MRRVVSVWLPTPPIGRPGRPEEEGRGAAPNPAKGATPLGTHLLRGVGGRGRPRRLQRLCRPLPPTPLNGIKGGTPPCGSRAEPWPSPAGGALRAAGGARSAGRAVDRRHRQHASAWRRDKAAARSGVATERQGWPPVPPSPTPPPSRTRSLGLAMAVWCRRVRTSWRISRSRHCACRPMSWRTCGCWGSSGLAPWPPPPARPWCGGSGRCWR